jgi:hypothetical protein
MKKERWDRKNFPEGYKAESEEYEHRYKMVDGTPWILIDQADLLGYFCSNDKYESQLLNGIDDYHSHYRPDAEIVFNAMSVCVISLPIAATRSRTGGLQPGKTGPAFLASRTRGPMGPGAIWGTETIISNLKRLRRSEVHLRIGQPYYLLSFAVAAAVVWLMPQSWDLTRRMTWPKVVLVFTVLAGALAMLFAQSYNPFIYFIF